MTTRDRIFKLLGSAPDDLIAFYSGGQLPSYAETRINVQPFDQAEEYTAGISRVSIVDRLGLWFLDDANDSNPYAYISRGPCSGMIIHFSHDDESRISFASLERFGQAMHDLGRSGLDIDDLQPDLISAPLSEPIRALASEDSEDATYLICAYLPICSMLDEQTASALLAHDDFFVREALANYLAENPNPSLMKFAAILANDRHPQVVKVGRRAQSAIQKIERG